MQWGERAQGSELPGGKDKGWACWLVGKGQMEEGGREGGGEADVGGCWKWWVRGEGLQQPHLRVWPWGQSQTAQPEEFRVLQGWGEDVFQRKQLGSFPGIL